jgi:undecaprenyl-diphosphatase
VRAGDGQTGTPSGVVRTAGRDPAAYGRGMTTHAPGRTAVAVLLAAGLVALGLVQLVALDSTDASLDVLGAARELPSWAHGAIELAGDGGLVVLAGLLASAAVSAWRAAAAPVLLVLLVGGAVLAAYGASELLKSVATEGRPCGLPGVEALTGCPEPDDWSLPSNHATIAAALAAAVVALAPRLAVVAVPLALVVASARVALGVHFLHDVLTGLALGGVVVACAVLAAPWTTRRSRRR